jgi:hypothetical protein
MPDEVAADHSGILVPPREKRPPTYNEVSNLLLARLGLEMPAATVEWFGKVLVSARRNEESRPSKPGMTGRITRLRDAALEISEALVSPPVLNRLAAGDRSFLAKWPDCWVDVEHVHQAAEAALLTIPKRKGRGRSATPEEISPRATCALLVAELLELSGHKRPRPTNAGAHAITDALWLASGGDPWTGHAKNLASWRPYFREITKASPGYRQALRAFVRMRLSTEKQAKQA